MARMKFGVQLHAERGVDAVLREARLADDLGFDSVWTGDHLLGIRGEPAADRPLESWTLMTAIGAITQRVRIAFAMLNPSFRNPAVLAKMLATLDQITHGRVICTLGAGWFQDEYTAYDVPFLEDHDERIAHEREVAQLLVQLWTHPAPQRTTFEGRFVRVRDLAFNPAPVQQPHPPIWIGGNSPTTQALVKELASGWVLLSAGDVKDTIAQARAAADWPAREIEIVAGLTIEAEASAQSVDERIAELESWGVSYVRLNFADETGVSRFDLASRLTSRSISDSALTSSGVKPGATSSSTKPPA
jgi:alkanesulfonate monooxygenase SsuD/methylene tetrahydromethanopterin reductase-like flavin-dependent oxidoreductase (luciferase family)